MVDYRYEKKFAPVTLFNNYFNPQLGHYEVGIMVSNYGDQIARNECFAEENLTDELIEQIWDDTDEERTLGPKYIFIKARYKGKLIGYISAKAVSFGCFLDDSLQRDLFGFQLFPVYDYITGKICKDYEYDNDLDFFEDIFLKQNICFIEEVFIDLNYRELGIGTSLVDMLQKVYTKDDTVYVYTKHELKEGDSGYFVYLKEEDFIEKNDGKEFFLPDFDDREELVYYDDFRESGFRCSLYDNETLCIWGDASKYGKTKFYVSGLKNLDTWTDEAKKHIK